MPAKQPAHAKNLITPNTTPRRAPDAAAIASGRSGERDENYNLISVLYHALQGADTASQYLEDARGADDEPLITFFEETLAVYAERAAEAKLLLADRLGDSDDEEEEGDDEEEDAGDDE